MCRYSHILIHQDWAKNGKEMSEKFCLYRKSSFLVSSSVFLAYAFGKSGIFYMPKLFGMVTSLEAFVSCGIFPGTLGIWTGRP